MANAASNPVYMQQSSNHGTVEAQAAGGTVYVLNIDP